MILTPGHTRGHVVFADHAAGVLFTGDHLLPDITPSLAMEPSRLTSPLRDYMDSLRVLLGVPAMRLLPAHGPVTDSVHAGAGECCWTTTNTAWPRRLTR